MSDQVAYQGAKVLVTGASGFIGSHLCRQLASSGAQVTGTYLHNLPQGCHGTWQHLDLVNADKVKQLIDVVEPDVVFHLASQVAGTRELQAVLPMTQNNLISTLNLMTALAETGQCKRLVLANSQEEPAEHSILPVPSSPYAAAKFAASSYARMFHGLYQLPVVIARIFMVYGPDQKDQSKLIPYCILKALAGEAPQLSSGTRKVDWIYVDDLIQGLLRLGVYPNIEGKTIELGSGQLHSIQQVVGKILQQINPDLKAELGAIPDRALEAEFVADAEQTLRQTGWRSQIDLDDGLAATIAWHRDAMES